MESIPQLKTLAALFKKEGCTLYAVGGMVRNPLLGLPISDMDICSALTPDEVKRLAERNGIRHLDIGEAFGMVALHMDGAVFEHTTFRKDCYPTGGGHRPTAVRFSRDIMEDAFRRDFTVNALYRDILTGELTDPTGGMRDIDNRTIRATSPDPAVIMGDDALRILRMVRFAAEFGFDIEENTFLTAKAYAKGLKDISAERVREELNKILLSDVRYGSAGAVYAALCRMDELRVIDVIIPELAEGRGMAQKIEYHKYDVLRHAFHTVQCIEPRLELRLAALLHDVGKPEAKRATGRMYMHDTIGEKKSAEILRQLKYPSDTVKTVSSLVRHHMYDLRGEARDDTVRVWLQERGRELSRGLIALRRADVRGSGYITGAVDTADRWERLLEEMERQHTPFTDAELSVTGGDIMKELGLAPGPEVGRVKRSLLAHCAKRPWDNNKERLLSLARDVSR